MVGAVFPTTYYGSYSRVLEAFQSRMSESGYLSVLLTVGFDNTKIFEPVRKLLERGVEGLMIVGRIDDERLIEHLLERKVPVVTAFSALHGAAFPSVGIDNYEATTKAMTHLLDLGHRKFAMLSGPALGNDRQQERQRAFRDALVRAGLSKTMPIYEDAKGYTLAYATDTFRRMRAQHPDVTAVVCNNDVNAMAALLEAQRMCIGVPERLSIVGFDDQDAAGLLNPGLTTISVGADTMGQGAADCLLQQLGGVQSIQRSKTLPTELIVRGSTGPHTGE